MAILSAMSAELWRHDACTPRVHTVRGTFVITRRRTNVCRGHHVFAHLEARLTNRIREASFRTTSALIASASRCLL